MNFDKKSPRRSGVINILFICHWLQCLGIDCGTKQEENDSGYRGIAEHVTSVINERIYPDIHPLGCIAFPKDNAREKTANKAQEGCADRADNVARKAQDRLARFLEGYGKSRCESERGKGKNIVKQDTKYDRNEGIGGRYVESEEHLNAGIYESRRKSPLQAATI